MWQNPYADVVHVCPNALAPVAEVEEFVIQGTTKPGIHPLLVAKRRVTYSYPADEAPKSVIIHSAGIDVAARQEVPVTSAPPPSLQQTTPPASLSAPSPSASPAKGVTGPVQVTGYSESYSVEEAIQDAIAQAQAKRPSPPREPDAAVIVEVTKIFARVGGNIRSGLFVTCTAR